MSADTPATTLHSDGRSAHSQPRMAAWLVANRPRIEQAMSLRLGPAAPGPAAVESEVLRRFRSFAASSLRRGAQIAPALEGIRSNERRVNALLAAWTEAAAEVAGDDADSVRKALAPLITRFRTSLRNTAGARRSSGAPRTARRAVTAAIDRVADAFLAVDVETGQIADANPAAGALLGIARDALLGVDSLGFVPESARESWWTELDAVSEGVESRRFATALQDRAGEPVPVDCTITRFKTRGRTLALILLRPS